jgi:acetylornithine deacetylase/succinyl-diaminopimelate desuccinylase-like protein
MREAHTPADWGECGYTLYERTTIRPALTVNGITGGSAGPGGKAIIPARAGAKLSFRLVPEQKPEAIEQLFREHIARVTPRGMRSIIQLHLRANPVVVDTNHPAVAAAVRAYRRGFGAAPGFVRSGGTSAPVNAFVEVLGLQLKKTRIFEILQAEGLRWRKQETWFGERLDPEFAEKRGASRRSEPLRPPTASC